MNITSDVGNFVLILGILLLEGSGTFRLYIVIAGQFFSNLNKGKYCEGSSFQEFYSQTILMPPVFWPQVRVSRSSQISLDACVTISETQGKSAIRVRENVRSQMFPK
jgi:hypothetical protein